MISPMLYTVLERNHGICIANTSARHERLNSVAYPQIIKLDKYMFFYIVQLWNRSILTQRSFCRILSLTQRNPPREISNTKMILFDEILNTDTLSVANVGPTIWPALQHLGSTEFLGNTATRGFNPWFKAGIHGVDGIPAKHLMADITLVT
jgi:hypothetical protein